MDEPVPELRIPGLTAPAEILTDPWGIPHIYAANGPDAFRAQGFQAARDRLWQLDTWRRRGLGLLAEAWGADYVAQDRAARLFLYRGDMRAEWLAYASDTKRIATAFTAGINAWIQRTRDDPALLPAEFRELGYEPGWWAPPDIARIRSHGLFHNLAHEVARALILRDFGAVTEQLRRTREPGGDLVIPDGLDLSVIPDDVLRDYLLATLPAELAAPPDPAASQARADQARADQARADQARASQARADTGEGSNNWALSPALTATGRPLLANDPHRAVSLPSLRYLAHLSCPEFDVIGAGEPALPGISAGHNGSVAFGFTIFAIDQEDLYVYRTRPGTPREYAYDGRWEPMRVLREQIPVRGGEPAEVELAFTRHGPVIRESPDTEAAFAVRAAWLEPGMAPYLGSIEYMRAGSLEQFTTALNRWGAPGENQVYAETGGAIAWKAAGLTPVRPNWDGTLPVPGDGRYEWAGFYDADELPAEVSPARGFVATANEMNLPAGFPAERIVTHDWSAPFRRQRIGAVLGSGGPFTAADLAALQADYMSLPARRIIARLAGLSFADPAAARAAALLAGWDARLTADSAAAALFETWYRRHLRPALRGHALAQFLPPARVAAALAAVLPAEEVTGDPRIDLDLIERPGERLGPDPDAALARLLEATLRDAMADLAGLLGPDETAWAWGRLHQARLAHPAAAGLSAAARERAGIAPAPRGGSADTVGAAAYLADFTQSWGATFRMVIDVGEWDSSLVMNSPGQSGDPASPHYADLYPVWAADGTIPLLYSRERVEAVAEQRIRLVPGA